MTQFENEGWELWMTKSEGGTMIRIQRDLMGLVAGTRKQENQYRAIPLSATECLGQCQLVSPLPFRLNAASGADNAASQQLLLSPSLAKIRLDQISSSHSNQLNFVLSCLSKISPMPHFPSESLRLHTLIFALCLLTTNNVMTQTCLHDRFQVYHAVPACRQMFAQQSDRPTDFHEKFENNGVYEFYGLLFICSSAGRKYVLPVTLKLKVQVIRHVN